MGYWQGDIYIGDPVQQPASAADLASAQAEVDRLSKTGDWSGYLRATNYLNALQTGQAPSTGPSGSGQLWQQDLSGLLSKMGITPEQYSNNVWPLMQGSGNQALMNAIEQYKGLAPNTLDQFGNQLDSGWSQYRGEQEALNKDKGQGTFLALLAAAVGGGALAAGGFGAGVGANAAGAMGLEAGAGAGLGLGAGEGLVGWDALGNAAGGGIGEVGSLAGEAGSGFGVNARMGYDPTGLGGGWEQELANYLGGGNSMDADLLALLDSPSGGGGSLSDWWSQAAGSGSNYSIGDLTSIAGLPSTNGLSSITDFLKGMGVDTSGLVGKAANGLTGGLLGGSSNNLLGSALGLAPILGGLAYGYNMASPDLSRLEGLYNQYNPSAGMGMYDYNTEMGRNQLYSNLGRRGIAGSSFANNDITNYNTQRDQGRGALLNQGVGTAANIANQIATLEAAGNKNKTDLIGRGLYSIGTLFGGK